MEEAGYTVVAQVETPNLIPVPPDWMQRQSQRGPNANRNINDIYWAKSERDANPGWIIVGPSAVPGIDGRPLQRDAERWIRKGRTPLVDYSYTDRVSPLTGHRDTIETNADRLGTVSRYYWFFRNGGAPLFPIEQIVEHHWHINPPFGLSLDVFPQLREWEVPEPFWCGACASATVPFNSEEQLTIHMQITHRMELPRVRELIASYDVHVKPAGVRGLNLRRRAVEAERPPSEPVAAPAQDQPKGKLHICNKCGLSFKTAEEQSAHECS